MLRGREVESDKIKEYVVERIRGSVSIQAPGTSEVPESIPRRSFNPLTWVVDPPEDVLVATGCSCRGSQGRSPARWSRTGTTTR